MQEQHYTIDELREYLSPQFRENNPEQDIAIAKHLETCPECKTLAEQQREGMWAELREKFKGFK